MNQMYLHLALTDLGGGGPNPPDYAGLFWLQWRLKLKHFEPNLFSVSVCSVKKLASGCGLCLFIYKHRYAWQWRKIHHFMFIYNSHWNMHGFVLAHEKWPETHNIAFFVIALVLPTDTQRATREHQLFASSTEGGLRISSYLPKCQ